MLSGIGAASASASPLFVCAFIYEEERGKRRGRCGEVREDEEASSESARGKGVN